MNNKLNIEIEEINNGFLTRSWRRTSSDIIVNYHKDISEVIKHLDTVWGAIDREIKKIREQKTPPTS